MTQTNLRGKNVPFNNLSEGVWVQIFNNKKEKKTERDPN